MDAQPLTQSDGTAEVDLPVGRLLEQIAVPAGGPVPDLEAIGAALAELATDLDFASAWAARLGARSGVLRIHAPARGPRLMIVHRLDGQVSPVHDHGTWVALAPVSGLETHRRFRLAETPALPPELIDTASLGPADVATLLPPGDIHDHGHVAGRGSPAYVLILTGDDQRRFQRHEWDLETGRHRVLPPGAGARWVTSDPWP